MHEEGHPQEEHGKATADVADVCQGVEVSFCESIIRLRTLE